MQKKIKDIEFDIYFDTQPFKKGDILVSCGNIELKVIKTYPFNWWRKLLKLLRLPYTDSNTVKVKYIIQ